MFTLTTTACMDASLAVSIRPQETKQLVTSAPQCGAQPRPSLTPQGRSPFYGPAFTNAPERPRPSLRYGPMLLAWNSKFGPRARWSDSSHSREPMDVNAANSADIERIEIRRRSLAIG